MVCLNKRVRIMQPQKDVKFLYWSISSRLNIVKNWRRHSFLDDNASNVAISLETFSLDETTSPSRHPNLTWKALNQQQLQGSMAGNLHHWQNQLKLPMKCCRDDQTNNFYRICMYLAAHSSGRFCYPGDCSSSRICQFYHIFVIFPKKMGVFRTWLLACWFVRKPK